MRVISALVGVLIVAVMSGRAAASDENPDPPPPDDVECPEGSIDMESNACIVDEEEECPGGFETIELGLGNVCLCESGQTDNTGACVTGGDDPNNDGCPPNYYAGADGFCYPVGDPNDPLESDGCPSGYDPTGDSHDGETWQMCVPDSDHFCWVLNTCHDYCPDGWFPQQHTNVCLPNCTHYGLAGHDYLCLWSDFDGDNTNGFRAIVTATGVSFADYYGNGQDEHFELDHSIGNECGPWETLIYGNCEALCEVYNVDCPTEQDPWLWYGYPRWGDAAQ